MAANFENLKQGQQVRLTYLVTVNVVWANDEIETFNGHTFDNEYLESVEIVKDVDPYPEYPVVRELTSQNNDSLVRDWPYNHVWRKKARNLIRMSKEITL